MTQRVTGSLVVIYKTQKIREFLNCSIIMNNSIIMYKNILMSLFIDIKIFQFWKIVLIFISEHWILKVGVVWYMIRPYIWYGATIILLILYLTFLVTKETTDSCSANSNKNSKDTYFYQLHATSNSCHSYSKYNYNDLHKWAAMFIWCCSNNVTALRNNINFIYMLCNEYQYNIA